MPRPRGTERLAWLRREQPGVVRVLMTSKPDTPGLRARLERARTHPFVPKPFDLRRAMPAPGSAAARRGVLSAGAPHASRRRASATSRSAPSSAGSPWPGVRAGAALLPCTVSVPFMPFSSCPGTSQW